MLSTLSIVVCLLVVLPPILYNRYGPFRYYTKMYLYYIVLSLVTLVSIGPSLLHFKDPGNFLVTSSILRRFVTTFGITFKVLHTERIRKKQRYVFVANHQTPMDILGLMINWSVLHPCVPVVEKKLLWVGPIGWLCWIAGSIFVDRTNPEKQREALREKLKVVTDGKCSLFAFPEGLRHQSTKMLKFRKTAFCMAIQCQVPILPIVYSQYSRFLDVRKRIYKNGKITMTILPEVSTKGMTLADAPALSEKVYDTMQSYIDDEVADMFLWGDPIEAEPETETLPEREGSMTSLLLFSTPATGTSAGPDSSTEVHPGPPAATKASVSAEGTAIEQHKVSAEEISQPADITAATSSPTVTSKPEPKPSDTAAGPPPGGAAIEPSASAPGEKVPEAAPKSATKPASDHSVTAQMDSTITTSAPVAAEATASAGQGGAAVEAIPMAGKASDTESSGTVHGTSGTVTASATTHVVEAAGKGSQDGSQHVTKPDTSQSHGQGSVSEQTA